MIRILLAEDQTLVRDGLCALLEMQDDFQVTAVTNGREAVEAARRDPPSLAVIDVRMPVMDGVECTRILKEEHPELPVLVLTTFDDHRLVEACLEAGANAYLLKDIDPDDLANAIRLLHAGESLIPGDLARRLLADERQVSHGPGEVSVSRSGEPFSEPLTPRQQEVLQLIAAGLSNKEIARRLYLSEGTVKNTVSEIYARLNVRDRVQAVLKYWGSGEARPSSHE